MIAFFISGYGITLELISPEISKSLHEVWLPLPAAFAFAYHSAYGLHLACKRWKIWNSVALVVLISYALAVFGGVLAFELAHKPAVRNTIQIPDEINFD